ncbi:MAG: four helix bundle protein [Pseudomonadota bacterium]
MVDESGFRFEKFDVWIKAMGWVDQLYRLVGAFPSEEKFGLTSQLKRSSVSVVFNIAEGSGRVSECLKL